MQAESLVKAQQDMGETMGELGLAFIKLTKFENEEAVLNSQRVRAADMKGVATAAVKASRLFRELNAQTVKHLVYDKIIVILTFQLYIVVVYLSKFCPIYIHTYTIHWHILTKVLLGNPLNMLKLLMFFQFMHSRIHFTIILD